MITSQVHSHSWDCLGPGIYEIRTPSAVLVKKCYYHPSLWFRVKGFLGKGYLPNDEGILLKPCNSIHTFFMQFPIDLVCIDSAGRVTRIFENVKPWRITLPSFRDHATIELAAHTLSRLDKIRSGTSLSVFSTTFN